MTDQPYTDEDLRAEAARQHATLTEDPDFMGVGEQMDSADIPSYGPEEDEEGRIDPDAGAWKWDELLDEDEFNAAQRKIHDLINGAADVSEWAVNLGADGLEPDGHTLQLGASDGAEGNDEPTVRMHFAFHPDMEQGDRDRFVMELSKVVLRNL
ncbi:hypothetical protein [Streptomyces sp. NPDC002346]